MAVKLMRIAEVLKARRKSRSGHYVAHSTDSGHPFQAKPATCFTSSRPVIPLMAASVGAKRRGTLKSYSECGVEVKGLFLFRIDSPLRLIR